MNLIKKNWKIILIIVISILYRIYNLDFQSAWLDEIHTMNESNPNTTLGNLYQNIKSGEQMPPLYFYLVYVFFKLLGYSVFIARLLSVIIGVLSIFSFYKLSKLFLNNKISLIITLFLSINSYHLYFSQEARPYILFFFFSIWSIFYLFKLLKNQNLINFILYGICSGLMITTHFFGLFILVANSIIIFIHYNNYFMEFNVSFLKKIVTSYVLIVLLFLPSVDIFISVSKIKEFWIPSPTNESFTLIFKEFFSNSEFLVAIISVLILFGVFNLFSRINLTSYQTEKDKLIGYLWVWIFVVIFIPLLRSYISVSIIITRYFFILIPAILLLVGYGLKQIKNDFIYKSIVVTVLFFSVFETVFVDKYFNSVSKAQFREAAETIMRNNKQSDIVISSLDWYYKYFFSNQKNNIDLKNSTLDQYVEIMMVDSTLIRPFWIIEGHNIEFSPSEKTTAFLNKKFSLENNFDGFQAWCKYYVPNELATSKISITQSKKNSNISLNEVVFSIENFNINNNSLDISGWVFIKDIDSENTKIKLVLSKEDTGLVISTNKVLRSDVNDAYSNSHSYIHSGFNLKRDFTDIERGEYQVYLQIFNELENKKMLLSIDKKISF